MIKILNHWKNFSTLTSGKFVEYSDGGKKYQVICNISFARINPARAIWIWSEDEKGNIRKDD